eukprot:276785-Pyramimonas_sp.AAC.1
MLVPPAAREARHFSYGQERPPGVGPRAQAPQPQPMGAVHPHAHGQNGFPGAAYCEMQEGGGLAESSRGAQQARAGLLRGPRRAEQPGGSRQAQVGRSAGALRRQAS